MKKYSGRRESNLVRLDRLFTKMDVTVLEAGLHHRNQSTNSSNNTTQQLTGESLEFKTVKIIFYLVILLSSTFGNTMVAYIICTTRKMRKSSNYLILNLAICDTLTPIISIPFDFILEENGYVWFYGGFMCKVLWPAATMTSTASALTLAVIALDRYRLIMHPFKPRLTSRVIHLAIVCTYVFAMSLVTPYVAMLELKDGMCGEGWPDFKYRQGYTLALFLVQYGLPLPFMVIMYVLALRNLYQSTRRTSLMQNTFINQGINGIDNHCNTKKKHKYTLSQVKEKEANKRATIMFVIVVTVFTIFMLPNQIIWLWVDFGKGMSTPGFERAMIICWLFTYSNSVFNPVIFTVFNRDFRNGFKRIFTSKCRRKSRRHMNVSRRVSHSLVTNGGTMSSIYTRVDTSIPAETKL